MQMLSAGNMKDKSPVLPDKAGLGDCRPSVTHGPDGKTGKFLMERFRSVCARDYVVVCVCACASACAS